MSTSMSKSVYTSASFGSIISFVIMVKRLKTPVTFVSNDFMNIHMEIWLYILYTEFYFKFISYRSCFHFIKREYYFLLSYVILLSSRLLCISLLNFC